VVGRDAQETGMESLSEHLDPIERALLAHEAAEREGVFRATPVDVRAFVAPGARAGAPFPMVRAGVAVAATVVMAVGVWSWLFRTELDHLRSSSSQGTTVAMRSNEAQERCDACIADCVTGPKPDQPVDCDRYDYDADGDVDLADFGRYQLAYAGPVR